MAVPRNLARRTEHEVHDIASQTTKIFVVTDSGFAYQLIASANTTAQSAHKCFKQDIVQWKSYICCNVARPREAL
jgi:hypothetical protein